MAAAIADIAGFGPLAGNDEAKLYNYHSDLRPDQWPDFIRFCEFLGLPEHHKPPMSVTHSKDKFSLWELWQGKNQTLSDLIDRDLVKVGSFISTLFPRQEYKGGVSGTHQSIVFESQVMDYVPEQAPNQRVGSYQESQSFTLEPKGISFIMSQDFIYAPDGEKQFASHARQIERCANDTLDVGVLWEIKKVAIEEYVRNHATNPYTRDQFYRAVQNHVKFFAMFQKVKGGHVKVQVEAVRLAENQAVTLTREILPGSNSLPYTKFADPKNFIYSDGGPGITNKEIRSDTIRCCTNEFPYIQSNVSRPYNFPNNQGPTDLWFEFRTVGEYVVANDLTVGRIHMENYRTTHRTIRAGHAEKIMDDLELLTLMDGSLIYEKSDGELTNVGHDILVKIVLAEAKCHGKYDEYRRELLPDYDSRKRAGSRKRNLQESKPISLWHLLDSADQGQELLKYLNSPKFFDARGSELRAAFVQHAGGAYSSSAKFIKLAESKEAAGDVEEKTPFTEEEFRLIPINGRILKTLALFDLRVPITFVFARRHIVFEAGQYVAMRDGADTGVTYTSKTIINLSRNTKQRLVGVDLNMDHCTAIYPQGRKNLVYIPDVLITNYHGGYDMSIYERESAESLHVGMDDGDSVKSGVVFAVNNSWKNAHQYLDVTGNLNRDMVVHNTQVAELMYPTAEEYRKAWRFPPPRHLFQKSSFQGQDPYANTFCLQGYQVYSIPKEYLPHPDAGSVIGQGHIGPYITPDTFRVFRGDLVHMKE
jgi:hypothetical protein